jgi:hypothetical protein
MQRTDELSKEVCFSSEKSFAFLLVGLFRTHPQSIPPTAEPFSAAISLLDEAIREEEIQHGHERGQTVDDPLLAFAKSSNKESNGGPRQHERNHQVHVPLTFP